MLIFYFLYAQKKLWGGTAHNYIGLHVRLLVLIVVVFRLVASA